MSGIEWDSSSKSARNLVIFRGEVSGNGIPKRFACSANYQSIL